MDGSPVTAAQNWQGWHLASPASLHTPLAAALLGTAACHTQCLHQFPNFGLALHGWEAFTIPTMFQRGEGSI